MKAPKRALGIPLCAALIVAALLIACSDEPAATATCPVGYSCTVPVDGGAGADASDVASGQDAQLLEDAAGPGLDAMTPAPDAGSPDSGVTDAGSDAGVEPTPDAEPVAEDTGIFGPPDIEDPDTFLSKPVGNLYAHDKDTLYVLNVPQAAFLKVGKFSFDKNEGLVTDIALNKWGALFAVTFTDLFQCNREDAKCVWLAKLPQEFNGLSFIPEGLIDPQAEVLVGIAEKGTWYRIIFSGGKVTLKSIGSYGGDWLSSGDVFSVVGIGTYATLKKSSGGDNYLVEIVPSTGKIKKVIGKTGAAKGLFGLAWWAGVFYAVSSDGNIYVLDVKTGDAQVVSGISVPKGVKWWGAGVSTRADGAGG